MQGRIILPNIYLNYICPLLLLIYLALNFSVPRADFSFLIKSVFSVCSFKESPDFGTSRNNHTVEKQPKSS